MTPTDIQKLVECMDDYLVNYSVELYDPEEGKRRPAIVVKLDDLMDLLNKYSEQVAEEPDKTEGACIPDFQGMYERCAAELEKAQMTVESLKFDMHNLSVEHAHYAGAVAAMETIFGRKFDPRR